MIYFPKSKGYISQDYPVAASASITAEGVALVADTVGGVFGVKPSAGTSGEKFVGIAVSQQMVIASLARVEEFVVPAGLSFTLRRVPSGGTISVYDVTAGAVVAAGGSGWTASGATVTVQSAQLGHTLSVSYKYAPSINESRAIQGDPNPGGAAGFVVGQVGAISNGTIYTSEFDTTVNWNASNPTVTLGANGQFTIGGSGATVPAIVIQAPSAASPFLGLQLTN